MMTEQQQREQGERIVTSARTWHGVPFCLTGRNRHGVDCGGLLLCVLRDLDLTGYEDRNYSDQEASERLRQTVERLCVRVDREPRAGDVLLLRFPKGNYHTGWATGEGTFIHARNSRAVSRVVESRFAGLYRDSLIGVYRFRGEVR